MPLLINGFPPERCAQDHHVVRPRSDVISRQPDHAQNALKIVVAVIFDLDPAALLVVMQNDVRAEILLEPVLQIDHGGRTLCCGRTAPATRVRTLPICRATNRSVARTVALRRRPFQQQGAALPPISARARPLA